jgi:hypothetical protein
MMMTGLPRFELSATRLFAALGLASAVLLGIGSSGAQAEQRWLNQPMVSGNYLDLCYSGSNCREGMAQENYCQSRGFQRALDWQTGQVPFLQATRKIGDGGVCNTGCTMITAVLCER